MLAMLVPLVVLYEVSIHLLPAGAARQAIVVPAESGSDDYASDDLGPALGLTTLPGRPAASLAIEYNDDCP